MSCTGVCRLLVSSPNTWNVSNSLSYLVDMLFIDSAFSLVVSVEAYDACHGQDPGGMDPRVRMQIRTNGINALLTMVRNAVIRLSPNLKLIVTRGALIHSRAVDL